MAILMMSAALPCMGGVDGVSLGQGAHHGVGRTDVGQVSAAAEDGFYVSRLPRLGHHAFHVLLYLRVCGEIAVDDAFRLFHGDVAHSLLEPNAEMP